MVIVAIQTTGQAGGDEMNVMPGCDRATEATGQAGGDDITELDYGA